MLEYFKFILFIIFLTVLLFFLSFVFKFQLTHTMTGVSHRKKLRLTNLIVPLLGEVNDYFWGPVNDSDLAPLLKTGYDNISHRLVCAFVREMA